jgi:hypothetical protein
MSIVVMALLAMHTLAAFYPRGRLTKFVTDIEGWRQHHEKCMLLAIIALAFWR